MNCEDGLDLAVCLQLSNASTGTEMSRRARAENQGNSGPHSLRRFEPMGLPFPKRSMTRGGQTASCRFLKTKPHLQVSPGGSADGRIQNVRMQLAAGSRTLIEVSVNEFYEFPTSKSDRSDSRVGVLLSAGSRSVAAVCLRPK